MRRRRTNAATVMVSLVIGLALAEAGLRVAGIGYPEFNRPDARLGWSPKPGLEGTYAYEANTRIRINREGFRDQNHAVEKRPGVFRVAVLGDSMTEGREVPIEATYWKVAERALASCFEPRDLDAEVLGFGVNGYGTAQEYLVLETYVWKYAPDVVLLAFFTGNDVLNNDRRLDHNPDRPYFVRDGNALRVDDSNLRTARFDGKKRWTEFRLAAYNSLRLLQVARQAYKNVKSRRKYGGFPLLDQLNAGLHPGVYQPPDGDWANAWAMSERAITVIDEAVAARGAELWLMTLTNPIQVYPDPTLRANFAQSLGVADLTYPERRLTRFAAERGIPYVALVEPLRARAEAAQVNLHGSGSFAGGHWNALGHRAAGEVLGEALCATYGADAGAAQGSSSVSQYR